MKIAVATDGNMVSEHFGHSPTYTIVNVENGKITSKEIIPNPGHQPGFLPSYLGNLGVNCVIVGGIGARAVELFGRNGIEVIMGAVGPVDTVIENYINGTLQSTESICSHGDQSCSG